jgi:Flp pilus assembly protein TadD
MAHHFLGETLCRAGKHDEALDAFRQSIRIRGANPETLSSVALALAQAGRADEARRALTDLMARAKREYVSPTRIAQVMAALGDVDGACGCLEKARIVRPTDLVWIKTHPAFGPLRADPRVQALQDEMGLA